MPRFDGSGPGGQSPGTGRGRGPCGGGSGRGQGRGRGMGGGGRCWGGAYGPSGRGQAPYQDTPPTGSYPVPQDELAELKAQAQMLTQSLEAIRHRMVELEKSGQ